MYSESLIKPMSRWYHPGTDSYHTVLGLGYAATCECQVPILRHAIYWSDTHQKWLFTLLSEFLSGPFIPLGPGGAPLPVELTIEPLKE